MVQFWLKREITIAKNNHCDYRAQISMRQKHLRQRCINICILFGFMMSCSEYLCSWLKETKLRILCILTASARSGGRKIAAFGTLENIRRKKKNCGGNISSVAAVKPRYLNHVRNILNHVQHRKFLVCNPRSFCVWLRSRCLWNVRKRFTRCLFSSVRDIAPHFIHPQKFVSIIHICMYILSSPSELRRHIQQFKLFGSHYLNINLFI